MKVELKQEDTYIPEWRDNKKKDVPMKILIQFPTIEQYDDCLDYNGKYDLKKLARYSIKEVLDFEPNGVKITTAAELLKLRGAYALFYEIANYVLRQVLVDAKNS